MAARGVATGRGSSPAPAGSDPRGWMCLPENGNGEYEENIFSLFTGIYRLILNIVFWFWIIDHREILETVMDLRSKEWGTW